MNSVKTILLLVLLFYFSAVGISQDLTKKSSELVGGPCEGCEAVFEFGEQDLSPVDTLPDFDDHGPKLKVTGTIYKPDGKTPAANVIMYVYHTNQEGVYPTRGNETGWAKRHGYIRGWIKTDSDGRYTFYTLKPGTYPSRSTPAHIHPVILEPNGKYYWLDSYFFEDDPLLTKEFIESSSEAPRGGHSGIMKLKEGRDFLVLKRDIILGKNIDGYE
jgi:protocatechuate 3,4-dioxygenase beta subunit